MINYDTGRMGLLFILQCNGSVFPKAMMVAIPNAIVGVLLFLYLRENSFIMETFDMKGVEFMWAGYTSVLGFLIVFRNNQAYSRFWEGATLIHQVRGEWFNAISSIFAFSNHSAVLKKEVQSFQYNLVRLGSLLHCSALQQVCNLSDDRFEVIDALGMEPLSLKFLRNSNDRCEVIIQWIQRLIVEGYENNLIEVPSPLLTRAFQELSRGTVNLNEARKIKEIPFPFPYAQMIQCMLIIHWVSTPFIASQAVASPYAVAGLCFCLTSVAWCLIFITMEIDQPFGDDPNDLPLYNMQRDFNHSLLSLMHPLAQRVPKYLDDPEEGGSEQKPMTARRTTLRNAVEQMSGEDHPDLDKALSACTVVSSNLSLNPKANGGCAGRRTRLSRLQDFLARFSGGDARESRKASSASVRIRETSAAPANSQKGLSKASVSSAQDSETLAAVRQNREDIQQVVLGRPDTGGFLGRADAAGFNTDTRRETDHHVEILSQNSSSSSHNASPKRSIQVTEQRRQAPSEHQSYRQSNAQGHFQSTDPQRARRSEQDRAWDEDRGKCWTALRNLKTTAVI